MTVITSKAFFFCVCVLSEQRIVCQGCYGVIKAYLSGDSRKNENYLARFVRFFKTQVKMELNAEEVMIEMVEDNRCVHRVMECVALCLTQSFNCCAVL